MVDTYVIFELSRFTHRNGNMNNMEKSSAQMSTVSLTSRTNEQTTEEKLRPRLPINSSTTTNETMPDTPQRNQIHSTLPQNQCAQHSAGPHAPTPTINQTTGNRPPATDGHTPHRDKGTQMPSQEIHTITTNQSTQFPSQQWVQTTTNEDCETQQSLLTTNSPPQGQGHNKEPSP